MSRFFPLTIRRIKNLTADAVEITFDVPIDLKEKFRFKAGQYITISHVINQEDVRRSYSLCSSPSDENISVGVKRIQGGKMSTFLTQEAKVGDILDVMIPNGNFILTGSNVVAICAGSGITPILSMIKTQSADFTLIYGNKSQDSAMFLNDIEQMNVKTHLIYSQDNIQGCYHNRINNNILSEILSQDSLLKQRDYFICGPGEMINTTEEFLLSQGIDASKIHFERFTAAEKVDFSSSEKDEIISNITVIIDGEEFEYNLSSSGETILDSAMKEGADVPFSCKGAVCCTCKAKVMEGKAKMDQNFSLSKEEVDDGYILTCQSHPITESIVVDFDEI